MHESKVNKSLCWRASTKTFPKNSRLKKNRITPNKNNKGQKDYYTIKEKDEEKREKNKVRKSLQCLFKMFLE